MHFESDVSKDKHSETYTRNHRYPISVSFYRGLLPSLMAPCTLPQAPSLDFFVVVSSRLRRRIAVNTWDHLGGDICSEDESSNQAHPVVIAISVTKKVGSRYKSLSNERVI